MFDNMVMQLNLQTLGKGNELKISEQEFDDFCKHFLFEQLKGNTKLGQHFCEKYKEANHVLMILPNDSARNHIKKFYVK
jgi:hypothetical protein